DAERLWSEPQREYATVEEMAQKRKDINTRLPFEWCLHLAVHRTKPGPGGRVRGRSEPAVRHGTPRPSAVDRPHPQRAAPADAVPAAYRALKDAGLHGAPTVIAGHGWGGFAAELLAAAGRAQALVLVDGLGGPWVDVDGLVADQHRWLGGVLADAEAMAPPAAVPDPRLAHG